MSRVAASAIIAILCLATVASARAAPMDKAASHGRKLKWGGYSGSWSGSWGSTSVNVQPGSTQTTVNTPWYSGSWGSNWGGGGHGGGGGGGGGSDNKVPAPAPGCYTYDGYGTYVNVGCDGSTTVNVNSGKK